MDDEALAAHLAVDLDGAFEALVLAHQDRLFTIALRLLGDPRDAEEVAQDGFVRAYRALEGYDRARVRTLRLRPWLAAIVVNLARNRRRRPIDRNPPAPIGPLIEAGREPLADPARGPEAVGLRRDAADRWAARLLRLGPSTRTAIVLRHIDGLSYDEIAEAVGRPTGTVKAQVHRGLALLRAAVEAERATTQEELTA